MLSQPPLVEAVPVYPSSGATLERTSKELPEEYHDLQHFAAGLMRPSDELYRHQQRCLDAVLLEGKDIVVTTGTGSGKTECFLLPLLCPARFLNLSLGDGRTAPAPPGARPEMVGRRRTRVVGRGQWAHTGRAATGQHALRAIILYPLNALVEDQLRRLRTTLDSDNFHHWLDKRTAAATAFCSAVTRGLTPPFPAGCERWNSEKGVYEHE